jgi:hypothetical protein
MMAINFSMSVCRMPERQVVQVLPAVSAKNPVLWLEVEGCLVGRLHVERHRVVLMPDRPLPVRLN